ncbi:ABC transporter ATP-binding protein [Virgibacillus siamensis]|uniref:ABC transporter ATP-binding protein n=1 Tax=Virgibacillus siamensis TaxID=480071 RepID=UPI0009843D5F|nr:ABC transporter ATP-binding protein [Virgibacillus siamensis]
MTKKVIVAKNLMKSYGESTVLKGISLSVYKGEVFGFVGHNGAGKSTLIHTLTGIINKTSGTFHIFDIPGVQLDKVKERIGVMPDISNLYRDMRGINFLKYMGSIVGDKRPREEYENLLHRVGLEGAGMKKIKTYSFGMKKKISIAQALLGDPEILFLDEPTSGLDPESAIDIRKMITELQKRGKTIFLTSHNLDEIEKISDRVGIISDGVIKKLGTPRELKTEAAKGIGVSVRTKPNLTASKTLELSIDLGINLTFVGQKKEYSLLNVASDEEIPKLSEGLIESGVQLYELKVEESTLEEVFMNA